MTVRNINIAGIIGLGAAIGLGVTFTQGWVSPEDFGLAIGYVGAVLGGVGIGASLPPRAPKEPVIGDS